MYLRSASIFCLLLCLFYGCKINQQPKLYGHWKLDSIKGRNGKIIKSGLQESEFFLLNDNNFIFKWSDTDLFGEYRGTYSYEKLDNETQLTFLILSPNKKDSIIQKRTLTVLCLNDSFMTTKEIERRVSFDSSMTFHNRICIYRRG
jgi:hypothetical protein